MSQKHQRNDITNRNTKQKVKQKITQREEKQIQI